MLFALKPELGGRFFYFLSHMLVQRITQWRRRFHTQHTPTHLQPIVMTHTHLQPIVMNVQVVASVVLSLRFSHTAISLSLSLTHSLTLTLLDCVVHDGRSIRAYVCVTVCLVCLCVCVCVCVFCVGVFGFADRAFGVGPEEE
jgi:hypothetical protein